MLRIPHKVNSTSVSSKTTQQKHRRIISSVIKQIRAHERYLGKAKTGRYEQRNGMRRGLRPEIHTFPWKTRRAAMFFC